MKIKKHTTIFTILIIFSVLSVFTVNAITATVLTGMIRINLEEAPTVLEKSLGVRNDNNETVNVIFEPDSTLKNMVALESYNITLEPDEQRFVKFNITINEMKTYEGTISSIFTSLAQLESEDNNTLDKVGMQTKILVVPVNGETSQENNNSNETKVEESNKNSNAIFLLIILIVIILSIIILRKRKK